MVHDQEEVHPHSRKRSYPFIQWINSDSPPQTRKSPDKDSDEEEFPASLPSPPLQSNKYKIFKQDLLPLLLRKDFTILEIKLAAKKRKLNKDIELEWYQNANWDICSTAK